MSAYLTDEQFEQWLYSGDLTISEWLEECSKPRTISGSFNTLLKPGMRTAFIEAMHETSSNRQSRKA